MYSKPAMTCFKYQVYLYGSEAMCYTMSGYRASTMSHQTAPHPPLQAALPPVHGSITFTHLKENFSMVKLPYLGKKSKGNPYGRGTITCETTIPEPCV